MYSIRPNLFRIKKQGTITNNRRIHLHTRRRSKKKNNNFMSLPIQRNQRIFNLTHTFILSASFLKPVLTLCDTRATAIRRMAQTTSNIKKNKNKPQIEGARERTNERKKRKE